MQDIDRSYLSQPEVVAASRNWTCIRLATYESAEEADYLKGIFVGRSGQLENTVFAFMSPQADKHLIPPGRGPRQLFRDPSDMAAEMDRLAKHYTSSRPRAREELPKVENLRLALNVAACEGLPVVLVTSAKFEKRLSKLAWSHPALGRAVYVRQSGGRGEGVYLLKPDKFGMKVQKETVLDLDLSPTEYAQKLSTWATPRNDHRSHLAEGFRKGIRWETKVPVTDPQAKY